MTMKKLIIIIFCFTSMMQAKAQDFHLTQYDTYTMYMNPALTGNYLGESWDYKAYMIYRTQWRTLPTKPYRTYGVAYDMPYKRFGIGGYLLDNKSGAMNFNTLNFQLSGSYFITDPQSSPHLLNVGVQAGLFYKTFNYNNLLFENQYDNANGQLNSSLNNGESFQKQSRTNFDANMGVFYKYKSRAKKYSPYLGFSVFHLNMPNETFGLTKNRLPMRFNVQAGSDFQIDKDWKLTPTVLYMNQAKASDLNIGFLLYYKIKVDKAVSNKTNCNVVFGANLRVKDAFMLQAGIIYDNFNLRMSYDVNTSYLKAYSKSRGAFELSLQISGKKGQSILSSISKFN